MQNYHLSFKSPLGILLLTATNYALLAIEFGPQKVNYSDAVNSVLTETKRQLEQYFLGERCEFDLPLKLEGTDFQVSVWMALQKIGYGQTATYGDIAKNIGNPKAVRAVGGANNKNPIPIIIPCHRIIGKDGSMTGYAGGLERKSWLLTLEKNTINT